MVFPKDFLLIIEILFINTQPLLLQKLQGGISQFATKNWGYLIPWVEKQLSMYLSLIDWVETKWLLHFIEVKFKHVNVLLGYTLVTLVVYDSIDGNKVLMHTFWP